MIRTTFEEHMTIVANSSCQYYEMPKRQQKGIVKEKQDETLFYADKMDHDKPIILLILCIV